MGGCGAFLLFAYSAKEHFFYDLSSLAAVSLLLLVAFGFSLLLVAGALWGGQPDMDSDDPYLGHLLDNPSTRARAERQAANGYSQVVRWVLVLYVPAIGKPCNCGDVQAVFHYPLLLWFASTGFIVAFLIAAEPANPPSGGSTHKELLLLPAVPFLVLFMSGTFGFFLDRAMILLSFRSGADQYVTLTEQSYRKVDALSHAAGIQVSACELRKDFWLLKGVVLVWHGIGATSYLRITGKPAQTLSSRCQTQK